MAVLILYLLLLSLPIALGQSESADVDITCSNGANPLDCSQAQDACTNTTCLFYPEAPCRLDPCNNCTAVFHDEETSTKLKCNGERLLCTSCFSQSGATCGGPGEPVTILECDAYQVCAAFRATFLFGGTEVPVFYRGCVPSDSLDDGGPSCYSDADTVHDHLRVIFSAAEDLTEGYGCVCTEDYCNNFDLESYKKDAIANCVDDFGFWFNPGEFRFISDCDASFCDKDGVFACRFEAIGCEFREYSYDHGEAFRSGYGDCVCNDGDIVCEAGEQEGLVCYVTAGQLKPDIGGIEFCDEGSICAVGNFGTPLFGSLFVTYLKRCVERELLDFDGDCTTTPEDVSGIVNVDGLTVVEVCKCDSNFCNEVGAGSEPPLARGGCEFDGKTYAHNGELIRDECNICICYNGDMLCTKSPCNGIQCYECSESTDDGPGNCGIVFCQEGEICAAYSIEFSGFAASYSFTQRCVNRQDVSFEECHEDVDTAVDLGLIQEGFDAFFVPTLRIIACNETLCNTMDRWRTICHPGTGSEGTPTNPPPKICYDENDPTFVYNEGETAVFGCRRCTCAGHLDFGQWSCFQICTTPLPSPETTTPLTDDGESCSFGSYYPRYESGAVFSSGCGECTCTDYKISCTRGKCPDLFCAVGVLQPEQLEFCDAGSLCLTKETAIPEIGILLVERSCLAETDWPYNDTMTQDQAFFGDVPGDAFVCSEDACNVQGYSQVLPDGCDIEDTRYDHQEEFAPDECNLCVCISGTIHCTREPCNGPMCLHHHEEEGFEFLSTSSNVTCLYDEVCISVTNVTLAGGRYGEHGECHQKSAALTPGQCTTDIAIIDPLFIQSVTMGTLCTISDQTETTTYPAKTTTQPIETTTEPAEMTSCKTEKGKQVPISGTVATDSCSCVCRKGTTDKGPVLSCDCELTLLLLLYLLSIKSVEYYTEFEVTIVFKEEFSTVADSLDEFRGSVTDELAKKLGVPRRNIKVEVYAGSIVVNATITSESLDTEDELKRLVAEGSFSVEHKGVELRADSIKLINREERTSPEPPNERGFYRAVISIVVIIGVLAIFIAIFAVCSVMKWRRDPKFTAFRGNYPQRPSQDQTDLSQPIVPETATVFQVALSGLHSTVPVGVFSVFCSPILQHDYSLPPDEFEPEDKEGTQEDYHRGVSNNYQSSLDFTLEDTGDVNYHKSIDLNGPEDGVDTPPPYIEVMDFDNPAFDEEEPTSDKAQIA